MGKSLVVSIGDVYNRLTVVELGLYLADGHKAAKCCCVCGKETIVSLTRLVNGRIKSCGCLQRERAHYSNFTHGHSRTRLYDIWLGIKKRCYSTAYKWFCNYGGRGIVMCDAWRDNFLAFYEWAMTHGYADNLTIERVDVNGNYQPDNCTWITRNQQPLNRRPSYNNKYGCRINLSMLAKQHGITKSLLFNRLRMGWSLGKALNTPNTRG